MKIIISYDEAYPVFWVRQLTDSDYVSASAKILEVDKATFKRWADVELAYYQMQNELMVLSEYKRERLGG
jgi:hypothetical protein